MVEHSHRHVEIYYHQHLHYHLTHYGDTAGFAVSHDEAHPHGLVSTHEHGEHGAKNPHSHKLKFEHVVDGGDHHDPVSHEWEKDAPEEEVEPLRVYYEGEEGNDEEADQGQGPEANAEAA